MKSRDARPIEAEIQGRFFQALNLLIESGTIRGLKTFCREYGLHAARYITIRQAISTGVWYQYRFIDLDAPAYLVRDYNVSCEWLMLGRGKMFRQPAGSESKDGRRVVSQSPLR
jgi:hypothetical protein